MILQKGEKIHVVMRRLFDGDVQRHFAGVVQEIQNDILRCEGYVFAFNLSRNEFEKHTGKRQRIVALADSRNIINIIPPEIEIDELFYGVSKEKHMEVTDGKTFHLDLNEFGPRR